MKSTILLTTAIFLASAPAPDSKAISELSAGFLSPKNDHGLMTAESKLIQASPPSWLHSPLLKSKYWFY